MREWARARSAIRECGKHSRLETRKNEEVPARSGPKILDVSPG